MSDPLAGRGLRTARIDPDDPAALRSWWEAMGRGFLGPVGVDARFEESAPDLRSRRLTGVFDDTIADPQTPVGTVDSWIAPLTLPGGAVLDGWAVSGVTVAPTHRRRGIARSLLEGELAAAAAAGVPLAMLTVSEATLYGRYGFGPATWNADLTIDPRRAGWRGPATPGRVQLVPRDRILADAPDIAARARHVAGTVGLTGLHATQAFGRASDDADLRARRFLRYDDAAGIPQGWAAYTATPNESATDYPDSRVELHALVGATDDAVAALWRTLLSFDLIGTVTAADRPVDDPVRWLVADPRAVRTTDARDHLWVRVLDVRTVLEARMWAGAGTVDLAVSDPLGYVAGSWRLQTAPDGRATVRPGGEGRVVLDADALGSLLLGGASAVVLAAAGRIAGDPDAVAELDRLARTARAPWLGFWF